VDRLLVVEAFHFILSKARQDLGRNNGFRLKLLELRPDQFYPMGMGPDYRLNAAVRRQTTDYRLSLQSCNR
jgi:hypothetical protein